MAKKTERGPAPSALTLNMLFANAAGRCQFEGCNKSVSYISLQLDSEITMGIYSLFAE